MCKIHSKSYSRCQGAVGRPAGLAPPQRPPCLHTQMLLHTVRQPRDLARPANSKSLLAANSLVIVLGKYIHPKEDDFRFGMGKESCPLSYSEGRGLTALAGGGLWGPPARGAALPGTRAAGAALLESSRAHGCGITGNGH